MTASVSLKLAGEVLRLLPERCMYWERTQTLLLADLHLGKSANFRASSVPIPPGTTRSDLEKLDLAIQQTTPQRLVILGDFWHGAGGKTEEVLSQFDEWRCRNSDIEILLIPGNHDRKAGDPISSWRITCLNEPVVDEPFVYCHLPGSTRDGYTLAGHLHPGVVLRGKDRQRLKLPCFWFGGSCAVLPAFGQFTGLSIVPAQPSDQIFAIAGDQVMKIRIGKSNNSPAT